MDWLDNEIHEKYVCNKYWWNHHITYIIVKKFFYVTVKSMIADHICRIL